MFISLVLKFFLWLQVLSTCVQETKQPACGSYVQRPMHKCIQLLLPRCAGAGWVTFPLCCLHCNTPALLFCHSCAWCLPLTPVSIFAEVEGQKGRGNVYFDHSVGRNLSFLIAKVVVGKVNLSNDLS